MTAPRDPATARPRRAWYLRPQIALPAVLAVMVAVAVLTPESITGRSGDARLTTHSTSSQGAQLLYELSARLGWRVERWSTSNLLPADPRTIVAVLAPPLMPSAIETHRVLEHVRKGGALLYVMTGGVRAPMNDSLHVRRLLLGGEYVPTEAGSSDLTTASPDTTARTPPDTAADTLTSAALDSVMKRAAARNATEVEEQIGGTPGECRGVSAGGAALPMWPDARVLLYQLDWTRPRPAGTVVFARAELDPDRRDSLRTGANTAAAGFPLGRGRVVVIADPDLLRNDVVRVCRWGIDVVVVRMLEYLADAGAERRDRLVFDEYHQGYGAHPGTFRAIVAYLSRAPSGHVLVQALLGGLVLLLALGPRALPPSDAERVERRSPLEHVRALASAYGRVGATRTATVRLLRGVRRRVERATRTAGARAPEASDEEFLDAAGRAAPALAPDVTLVREALAKPVSRRELEAVGAALRRIESSFLTFRR